MGTTKYARLLFCQIQHGHAAKIHILRLAAARVFDKQISIASPCLGYEEQEEGEGLPWALG